MKATEFVKEKGIGEAKAFLDLPEYTIDQLMMLQAGLRCVDLKRIVDSHGIVESHKFPEDDETGLDGAHCLLDMYGGYDLVGEKLERLKQAISDVEACQ